jgi:hypothetical protein
MVDMDFNLFTKRIYMPGSYFHSFSRYSPFTLTYFFQHAGKLPMPAAERFYPDCVASSEHHI